MSASKARTRAVIVNYKTAGLTIDALRSLEPQRHEAGGLVATVVDNASGDGSADAINRAVAENGWGDWVTVMPLAENRGFAAGNNAAIVPALGGPEPPEFVWLLNPDTVCRPEALTALVEFLDRRPEVGLAGSRLEDPDGTPQRSAFRFPSAAGEFENGVRLGPVSKLLAHKVVAPPAREEAHPTDWVAGASVLVRRAVFADAGLLDDGYFLYFEEVDFCKRALDAGWPCWYVPASRVVHLVGQSSGVTDTKRPARRVPAYWFAARRRYFRKHHRRRDAATADVAWAVGYALWRLRRRVQFKPDTDPPHLLGDFVRHNFFRAPEAV